MKFEDVASVNFKGVKISNVCYENVCNIVTKVINENQRGYICLNDVSNLMVASKNEQMRTAVNGSLLSLADGTPLAWYGWMVGCKEIERISGASLMRRLLVDMDGCKHYLLGDTEQTISKVTAEAIKLNSKIEISGHSPPFKTFDADDNQRMIERIRKAAPDIIWVSFGGVKQEKWMNQNISGIDRGVMIGVGAAFKFLVGDIKTPPEIVQKMGLQWLYRMPEGFIKNPRTWLKITKERELLTSKLEFLLDLPREVKATRQQIKIHRQEKYPT